MHKQCIASFVALFLITSISAQAQKGNWKELRHFTEQEKEWLSGESSAKGESKQKLRADWFNKMRTYPNKDTPPNAQQRAWEQAQKLPIVEPRAAGNGIGIQSTTWEFWGPDQTSFGWLGRVNAIAPHPTNSNILYIGVAQGGLWKSADGGTSWASLTDTLSSQMTGCVTLDPVNPNTTIYFGTGEEYYSGKAVNGVGVWKSTDGGISWTLKGNSTFAGKRVNEIVIDPGNTNHWIVSCNGDPNAPGGGGIFTTADGGNTFTQRLVGTGSALRMHPTNSSILFAALGWVGGGANGNANGLYKSTDGGNTWTLQTINGLPSGSTVGRIELDICKSNPNVIWVAFGNLSTDKIGSIWKTTNGGASWAPVTLPDTGAQQWYDLVMRVDPVNPNIAYTGTISLAKTTDGGTSWGYAYPGAHPDQHVVAFDPNNHDNVYFGNDGGLFKFTATSSLALNFGRGTMEFYAFDVHPTDPLKLAAGAQDNGPHIRTTDNTYTRHLGGDGIAAAYNRSNGQNILVSLQFGYTLVTTDAGANWLESFVPNRSTDAVGFAAPLLADPNVGGRFYTGTHRVWRTNSNGAAGTWSPISGTVSRYGYNLTALAVAPSDSNTVYTGAYDGGVFVSTNAGNASPTWTDRSAGVPVLAIGGIAVHPTNPQKVYVGCAGYGATRVLMSTNGGAAWTNITGNLPDAPVWSLLVNPSFPTNLYAATDVGVFVTSNEGGTWARFGTGLPSMQCTMLRANATTGYLTVSTYGRGIWRIPLNAGNAPAPIAGLQGAALKLNGTTQGLSRASLTGLTTGNRPHTIEAWVKMDAPPPNRAWLLLLGAAGIGNHHWLIGSTGQIQFGVWNGGQVNGPTLPTGLWTHVASTFDGTTYRVYLNGTLAGSSAAAFNFTSTALSLGAPQIGEDGFNGSVDEVRLFNRARTQTEIQADMHASLKGDESGLFAYYRINEGTGSATTADASGQSNTATLLNAPAWQASGADINTIHVSYGVGRAFALAGFDPSGLALTYTVVANPAKGTLSGTAPNLTYTSGGSYTGTDSFTYKVNNGSADSPTATVNIDSVTVATLSGKITLQSAQNKAQSITFTFRPNDGSTAFNRTVTLSGTGDYSLTNVPRRNYSVHIKGAKWLAKNLSVNLSSGNVTGANVTLLAGDANNDNSVDVLDLDALIQAFDAALGDSNWNNGVADFNCDNSVDVLDLDLLISNFDAAGDA